MVKRTWEASRGLWSVAGGTRTQSSWRVAREEIRALAGVAALALRPVHTRVVVAARLGAGSAKAGWAWRRWRGGSVGVRGGCGR
ncbi:hypothetical protein GUJ93_ZPchr0008g13459 [Zizania palustris]|uniref:Uncharacterized protein n=1 Tax=Zizania palustris TaxID=103762 RepID=A0A8J5R998_ZIZPA|nr:hypothetical protein GUJ93_ZPchr0008g13459 [Zizania palustris]